MLRKLLVPLLLTAGFRLAAAVFALSGQDDGGRRLADLAVAELSGRFEFVERQEVDAVRREAALTQQFAGEKLARKLRLIGADLFAAVETLPGGGRQLTIFESSCGFRLKQLSLPGDDAAAVRAIGEALAAAVNWNSAPESVRFVSVAGVRNNLHYSLKEKASSEMDALLRRAAALDMVRLEREYLIELLRERSFSGKWEKAVTASEFLHFELNPGSTAKSYTVAAYFTDPAGKIVFRNEYAGDDPGGRDRMFAAIADYLKTPGSPAHFDRKTEAARFARESAHMKSGDSLSLFRLRFAAFALDTENRVYLAGIPFEVVDGAYPWLRAVLEHLVDKPELMEDPDVFSRVNTMLSVLWRDRLRLSPADRKAHWEFMAIHRNVFLDVFCYDKERKGDETFRLLVRFGHQREFLYPNRAEYIAAVLANWNAILDALAGPARKVWRGREWKWLVGYQVYESVSDGLFDLQAALPRKELAAVTSRLVGRIEATGIPELKPLVVMLEANALLYSRDYTEEKALAAFEKYWQLARESEVKNYNSWYSYIPVSRYPGLLQKLNDLSDKNRSAAGKEKPVVPKVEKPVAPKVEKPVAPKVEAPVAPKVEAPVAPKVETNDGWKTTKLWPDGEEKRRILASAVSDDFSSICFLTRDEFDFVVMRLDSSGQVTKLATFPQHTDLHGNHGWQLCVEGDDIAVAYWDALWCGKAGERPLRKIKALPIRPHTLWIRNGRIFALGEYSLMSFDFSGNDRKMHFSRTQEGSRLKAGSGYCIYGTRGGEGEIILICSGISMLEFLRYRLADGSCEKLAEAPSISVNCSRIIRSGDSIFWYCGSPDESFGSYYFRYDISANRVMVPVYGNGKIHPQNYDALRPYLSHSIELKKEGGFGGAYLMRGNMLYVTGILPNSILYPIPPKTASAAVYDLDRPESDALILPAVNGLYPAPDGKSVIAVGFDRIDRLPPVRSASPR